MRQDIQNNFVWDDNGNPSGGSSSSVGLKIDWQDGPLGNPIDESKINGAFVEGVLQAALGRLQFYQQSKFNCRENSLAITKIEEALHWLDHRTADRKRRGVEGTYEA